MERHNKIFAVRQSVKSGIESCLFFLVVEVCVWGVGVRVLLDLDETWYDGKQHQNRMFSFFLFFFPWCWRWGGGGGGYFA